jgi:hypothetical protein
MTKTIQLNSLDEKLDAVAAAAKSVLFELEVARDEARKAGQHFRHAKLAHVFNAMRDFVLAAAEPRV